MKKILFLTGCIIIFTLVPLTARCQVTDVDGNTYKTVRIGTQVWMAENLRTTKYSDGRNIPLVKGAEWNSMSSPGYCWYNNDFRNFGNIFGALYNWHVIKENICPVGWHVPDNNDWKILTDFLGGKITAGGKLKETGTGNWKAPNAGATNSSGFTALPGGGRWVIGRFDLIGRRGFWWSSSILENESEAITQKIYFDETFIRNDTVLKGSGFSIRCVKDQGAR